MRGAGAAPPNVARSLTRRSRSLPSSGERRPDAKSSFQSARRCDGAVDGMKQQPGSQEKSTRGGWRRSRARMRLPQSGPRTLLSGPSATARTGFATPAALRSSKAARRAPRCATGWVTRTWARVCGTAGPGTTLGSPGLCPRRSTRDSATLKGGNSSNPMGTPKRPKAAGQTARDDE
jgi:hypothetical protein